MFDCLFTANVRVLIEVFNSSKYKDPSGFFFRVESVSIICQVIVYLVWLMTVAR